MASVTIFDVKKNNSCDKIYSCSRFYYSNILEKRILLEYFIDNDICY